MTSMWDIYSLVQVRTRVTESIFSDCIHYTMNIPVYNTACAAADEDDVKEEHEGDDDVHHHGVHESAYLAKS